MVTCFSSCTQKSPIHYYNQCTGGVNAASAIFIDFSGHLNRLYQDGVAPPPNTLGDHYSPLLTYQQGLLENIRNLSDEEAGAMISASEDYLSFTQEVGHSETFRSLLAIMDSGVNVQEMLSKLDVHDNYIESTLDREQVLYEAYYQSMSAFASNNGIDESLWKRSE